MTTEHRKDSLKNKLASVIPAITNSKPVDSLTKALGGEPPKADADMQLVLDTLQSLGGKPIETLTPAEARLQPTPTDAVAKLLQQQGIVPPSKVTPPKVASVKRIAIPGGPVGDIPAFVYTPEGEGPFPVILYFHGGGFVIANTKVYESSILSLAQGVQAIVVSLEYHQAPEYQYPVQVNEAFTAYSWLLSHAQEIKGNPDKIALAGESAGGNLAAVVSLKARDSGLPLPLHQLLVYPVVTNNVLNSSYVQNANAKPLNAAMMKWFFKHYSEPIDAFSAYALPDKADSLSGLPATTLITAEIDPLYEEGKDFAERLAHDGVAVHYQHYEGVTHEFFGMGAVVNKARQAQEVAISQLRKAFFW